MEKSLCEKLLEFTYFDKKIIKAQTAQNCNMVVLYLKNDNHPIVIPISEALRLIL